MKSSAKTKTPVPRSNVSLPAFLAHAGQKALCNAPFAPGTAFTADGWQVMAEIGAWDHPSGDHQVIDALDIALLNDNFHAFRQEQGAAWKGIPLYIGHPEVDGTLGSAPAYCWYKDSRVGAAGALEWLPEFTPEGQKLIDDKTYKAISNYWWGTYDGQGFYRPFFISSTCLTNNPVITTQKPLANASTGDRPVAPTAADPAAPAPLPNAAGPWWQAFTGALGDMLKDATDTESARKIIWDELCRLWQLQREWDALQTLIDAEAERLGVFAPPPAAAAIPVGTAGAAPQPPAGGANPVVARPNAAGVLGAVLAALRPAVSTGDRPVAPTPPASPLANVNLTAAIPSGPKSIDPVALGNAAAAIFKKGTCNYSEAFRQAEAQLAV